MFGPDWEIVDDLDCGMFVEYNVHTGELRVALYEVDEDMLGIEDDDIDDCPF